MNSITIYTPISNNYEGLNDIYKSLLAQTFKQFNWLIIDYGAENKAKPFVDEFLKVHNFFNIDFIHRPTKGRYLTTAFAFNYIKTKYIVGLDGNYKLHPNAIEIIHNTWSEIECSLKSNEIAEIRGIAIGPDGSTIGRSKYKFDKHLNYFDAAWHEMVLKRKNYFEMLASWDREKFLQCVDIKNYCLFSNRIDEVHTILFWSSIGRKYKTRYLNHILKIRINTPPKSMKQFNRYNEIAGNYYFLKQNMAYVFYNPLFFIKSLLILVSNVFQLFWEKFYK